MDPAVDTAAARNRGRNYVVPGRILVGAAVSPGDQVGQPAVVAGADLAVGREWHNLGCWLRPGNHHGAGSRIPVGIVGRRNELRRGPGAGSLALAAAILIRSN